jgi:putative chitinase
MKAARARLEQSGALARSLRAAHLIGQCAHESGGFTRTVESLFYTTPERLMAVWPSRFPSKASAEPFVRQPERLANHVYANRNGNGPSASGDGFRFRGRGYLQLTGRANYRALGTLVGVDLEAKPEAAAEPATAWLVAGAYLETRRRNGRTAVEWADANDVVTVTRIVNGGVIGLEERRQLTARALAALDGLPSRPALQRGSEGSSVLLLQRLLAERGFTPGALDGDFGPKTESALAAFQASAGLAPTRRAGPETWQALEHSIA